MVVSEAGMERLTKEPIISAIGVDIKDFNDLERIDSELQASLRFGKMILKETEENFIQTDRTFMNI